MRPPEAGKPQAQSPLYACPVAIEFYHLYYCLLYSTDKGCFDTFLHTAYQDEPCSLAYLGTIESFGRSQGQKFKHVLHERPLSVPIMR